MGRVLFLLCYIPSLLICACSIDYAYSNVRGASKSHLLTSVKYVVKVECANSSGTGVIFDGKILTAAHVVGDTYNCVVSDYKGNLYQSYPIKQDKSKDLAILKVDGKLLNKGIRLANKSLNKYDEVYTIGFPLSLEFFMTRGEYQYDFNVLSFTNVEVMSGNSGGPLFVIQDNTIRLVGICHAVMAPRGMIINHLSTFISLKTIKEFIND